MRILLLSVLLSTLGNADIVKLVKAGLSPETVEAKIAASETRFDTSTDALVALAGQGVPDRVIRKMIEAKGAPARASVESPKPPAQAAAKVRPATTPVRPLASRRYDVTLHGENGGKCEAELRVDGKGIKASRCGALDFEVAWRAVETACHDYGFRGALTINGRRISTHTPAEAKRIVEQVRERVAIAACRQ
ncbi:MAG TPA: hypothetical protein VE010_07150 [Thermoanaerobaculia bacterium]|nr:hypothetical protein [Thermoanaerobaculia bacterium]